MTVILTPWKNQLLRRCAGARRIRLVCPFVKTGIARAIIANSRPDTAIDLVTRNKPSDFAAGVSDIDALKAFFAAKEFGIEFSLSVVNSVHAKVFIFDEEVCYVGSSNLTAAGLERSLEGAVEITDRSAVAEWIKVHSLMRSKARPASAADLSVFEAATRSHISRHRVERTDEGLFYESGPSGGPDKGVSSVYASAEDRDTPVSASFQNAMDDLVEALFPEAAPVADLTPEPEPPRATEPVSVPSVAGSAAPSELKEASRPPKADPAGKAYRDFASLADHLFDIPRWHGPVSSAHALVHASALGRLATSEVDGRSLEIDRSLFSALNHLGHEAFRAAAAVISARSGLVTRYGPAFNSVVTDAFRSNGFLPKTWKRHLLPDPTSLVGADFAGSSSPTARRRVRLEATHRLLGIASLSKGQNEFLELVETAWNPLVEYGSDVIEFALAKEPKTKMQETCAIIGQRPVYADHAVAGTDHAPEWSCTLTLGSWKPVRGSGTHKQGAEIDAIAKMETALSRDPVWQRAAGEYRKKTFRGYTAPGPFPLRSDLVPRGNAAERLAAAADRLGIPLDVPQLYGCLVNRQIRQQTGIDFDNSPLAQIGSAVAGWLVTQWIVENGHTRSHAALANAVLPRLGEMARFEGVYDAANLRRHMTQPFLLDAFQSVLASLVLFGPEGTAAELIGRLMATVETEAIVGIAAGGDAISKFDAVERGIGEFDPKADYITLLQEFVQRIDKTMPGYDVARAGGPDHLPTFRATVTWRTWTGEGMAPSGKMARRMAAHAMLRQWRGTRPEAFSAQG